jgi:hypothetical protein
LLLLLLMCCPLPLQMHQRSHPARLVDLPHDRGAVLTPLLPPPPPLLVAASGVGVPDLSDEALLLLMIPTD